MAGRLYLVATPIGNLEDITFRALKVLKEVDLIAAEDTRHTLGLLNHFEITKPLISYYKETEKSKSKVLIQKLLEGNDIALVSDAGTPGISDPGEEVIKEAIDNNIEIVPIPGAVAAINALIASGFSTREFAFIGFLSANKGEKYKKLEELKYETKTLIIYEAPHKIINTLQAINEVFGSREVVLAKELTKIHECFIRGSIEEVLEVLGESPKGEYVIVVKGNDINKTQHEKLELNELSLEDHFAFYEKKGLEKKEIIKQIAKDRNVSKNEIYQYFINK